MQQVSKNTSLNVSWQMHIVDSYVSMNMCKAVGISHSSHIY